MFSSGINLSSSIFWMTYYCFSVLTVGSAITDTAAIIEQANKAYQDLLGCDEIELENLLYLEMIHPDFQMKFALIFLCGAIKRATFVLRFTPSSGEELWSNIKI